MVLHRVLQVCFLFSLVWLSQQTSSDVQLQLLYSWQWMDFAYESAQQRSEAIQNRQFIPENVVTIDADYFVDPTTQVKRYLVTTPAIRLEGFPATLSEVIIDQTTNAPVLQPFPSWEANDKSSCNGLISIFRMQFDSCGNLWVVDSGKIDAFATEQIICTPKLIIYDMKSQDYSELVRYEFPDQFRTNSLPMNIVIESAAADCSDAVAYIADTTGFGIVVYDRMQTASWRVEHTSMNPYPEWIPITVTGFTFNILMDGIFGLSLGTAPDNIMKLYYNCFAGVVESYVPTSILKDQSTATNTEALNGAIVTSGPARDGQSTVSVITPGGIMIYVLVTRNALACWNTALPFTTENQYMLYQDDENFQFITSLKIHNNELLILSTRIQNFVVRAMEEDAYKYRILSIGNIDDLLKDTPCSPCLR